MKFNSISAKMQEKPAKTSGNHLFALCVFACFAIAQGGPREVFFACKKGTYTPIHLCRCAETP